MKDEVKKQIWPERLKLGFNQIGNEFEERRKGPHTVKEIRFNLRVTSSSSLGGLNRTWEKKEGTIDWRFRTTVREEKNFWDGRLKGRSIEGFTFGIFRILDGGVCFFLHRSISLENSGERKSLVCYMLKEHFISLQKLQRLGLPVATPASNIQLRPLLMNCRKLCVAK